MRIPAAGAAGDPGSMICAATRPTMIGASPYAHQAPECSTAAPVVSSG